VNSRRKPDCDDGDDGRTDGSANRRLHTFKDCGEPIDEADYQPVALGIPEYALAVACISARQDFGGPLSTGDLILLAEMATALAGPSADLAKKAEKQGATKKVREANRDPAPAKNQEERSCVACEGTFLTAKNGRKFCSPLCGAKWRKRAARLDCQPVGKRRAIPPSKKPPIENEAWAVPARLGNKPSESRHAE
jgi:hypothetical protein